MAGISGVNRAQTPPYKGPMGPGPMGPNKWAMGPWAHDPWAMGPGAGAGPRAGATLGAGPLRFLENPQEKRDPEKWTPRALEKYVFENIFGKVGPENRYRDRHNRDRDR